MGFFDRLKQGLLKTKNALKGKVDALFKKFQRVDEDLFDELEELLISADIGVNTTEEILDELRDTVKEKKIKELEFSIKMAEAEYKIAQTEANDGKVYSTIDGEVVGQIGKGFLILLGVGPNDTEAECRCLAEKALGLRIFEDENEKMNLGLEAVGGQVLVVSQFTLYGNCRKGRRPSFVEAAPPALGEELYEKFLSICTELGYPPQHGRFGASMQVESVNDGPVTLILDTDQLMNTPRR